MFYVDDRFHGSDPVLRIPRELRLAAVGLWTLAGTWSAQFLKDGHVAPHVVANYDGGIEAADALVEVKLWRRTRGGAYQFRDWAKWQKTREQVEAYRAGERDRKSRARAATTQKLAELAEITGAVPPGSRAEPALPHPHPSPTPMDNDQSQQQLASGSPQVGMDSSSPVDKARRNPTGIEEDRITARLQELLGDSREATRLDAQLVAEHFLERGGPGVKYPTRYVLGSITRGANVVANYLHTGRWSE